MSAKVSVIIPVYNVEGYLRECLDSVLGQDYENFEVILVDNMSTDGSYEICAEYAKKYSGEVPGKRPGGHSEERLGEYSGKVQLYRCEKWGAAAARNFGVEKARGEYIWFVDADDYVEKGAIRKLVDAAEASGADVVVMAIRRVYEDGHEDILTAVDTTKEDWRSRYVRYGLAVVQNLYRREFWVRYLGFPEGMIHEDMAVLSAAVLYTDKVAFVEEALYNYRQRAGSVLHQGGWNPRALDIFKALGILYGKFNETGKLEEYHDEIEYFFIWNLLIDSAKDFYGHAEGKSGQEQTRAMLKKFFPKWRKNKFFRQKPLKFRLNCYRGYLGLLG